MPPNPIKPRHNLALAYGNTEIIVIFCEEQDDIKLLGEERWQRAFLNMIANSGLVIYDPKHLDRQRIILARQWLLDPIYTLFDRTGPYKFFKARGGLCRDSDLQRFLGQGWL